MKQSATAPLTRLETTHNAPQCSGSLIRPIVKFSRTSASDDHSAFDTIFALDLDTRTETYSRTYSTESSNRPATWWVMGSSSEACVFNKKDVYHSSRAKHPIGGVRLVPLALDIDILVTAFAKSRRLRGPAGLTQEVTAAKPAPATGAAVADAAGTEVAAMEARQQRDAILLSRDLRAAVRALIDDEGVSVYDLGVALGVSRANLGIWRSRPVEKLRSDTTARLSRLLFAWKFWLRVSSGEQLGRWMRDALPSGLSLLDVLCDESASEEDLERFVLDLAAHAKQVEGRRLARRRDLAGLPTFGSGSVTVE
jgi:hypothetical protein